nr:MAG TPA: hypothetical protein [Caudoviricetes sp.]
MISVNVQLVGPCPLPCHLLRVPSRFCQQLLN